MCTHVITTYSRGHVSLFQASIIIMEQNCKQGDRSRGVKKQKRFGLDQLKESKANFPCFFAPLLL